MENLIKLLAVQQGLKAPKDQRNTFGGYNYRSCESILEAVKPLLKEQKLVLFFEDSLREIGNRIYVCATARLLDAEAKPGDGTVIIETTAYAREEETKKGMDASQVTGAASSYARKYALNAMFAIDDTKDADTDEYQKQSGVTKPEAKKEPAKPAQKPAAPNPTPQPVEKKGVEIELSADEEETFLELCSDIDNATELSNLAATVSLAKGQKFEQMIRDKANRTAISKGWAKAKAA